MIQQKLALISNYIVLPSEKLPVSGALLIESGQITSFVPRVELDASSLQGFEVEDLGDLFISPGVVDMNVYLLGECISSITRAGVSGGVTTIATHESFASSSPLFTDIAQLRCITDENLKDPIPSNVWGLKAFIAPSSSSGHLSRIEEALELAQGTVMIVHPEYYDSSQVPESKPLVLEMNDMVDYHSESDSGSEDEISSEKQNEEEEGGHMRTSLKSKVAISSFLGAGEPSSLQLTVPDTLNVKRNSMQHPEARKGSFLTVKDDIRNMLRHSIHCTIDMPNIHIPIQDLPFINETDNAEECFYYHKCNFPVEWELNAIKRILEAKPSGRVHFSNISTCQAGELLKMTKQELFGVSADTGMPYLYFNEKDIKPSDTRYKIRPPIRDKNNQKQLIESLRNGNLDCISSYHQPVAPPEKFLGDFKEAVDGITSMGFCLQAAWTRLKQDAKDPLELICSIGKWLSQTPAQILNIQHKGSLEIGKEADLVVWDPFSEVFVNKSFCRYPDLSPFMKDTLWGDIHRTYIRGKLVYTKDHSVAEGKVLEK